ncbi:hypothetical protein Unana1_00329 [Umbelopsis nana]
MELCRADDLSPPATPPGSSVSSSSPSPTLLTRPPQRLRQSYPDQLFGDMLLQPSTLFSGCEFDHLQQIKATFQHMDPLQKQYFLYEILNCCDTQQLNFVSTYIAPRLKIDFLKELPIEISLYILSFIDDPKTLARASRVSTFWNSLLKDETTWKSLCHKHHYRRRNSTINGTALLGPPVTRQNFSYREYFKRKYNIEAAWENGGKVSTFLDSLDPGLVTSLQFDDNIIVAGCDNHKIEVFDSKCGTKLRTMEGHEGGVWALQFSGTGEPGDHRILASGGCDRNVRVWDLDTGRLLHVMRGHTSTVRCLKLRDKKTAVTGSRDHTLRVWDLERGMQKFVLLGHQASVRCLEIHGNLAVSGSYDSTARIWDLDTGRCRHVLSGHYSQIYSIAFDGEKVVTGSLDTNIRVWNTETGQCIATLHGHTSLVGQLQLSGHTLVSGGSDGCLRVWDLDSLECIHRISAHDNSVTCLQFDDRRIISGGNDGRTKLWDIKTGRLIRHLTHPAKTVWRLQFNDTKAVIVMQRRRSSNPDEGRSAMELHNFDVLEDTPVLPDEDVEMIWT